MVSAANVCNGLARGAAYTTYIIAAPLAMIIGLVRSVATAIFSAICYWKQKQAEQKGGAVSEVEDITWQEAWGAEFKRGLMEFLLPFIGSIYWTYKDYSYEKSIGETAPGLLGFGRFTNNVATFS